MSKNCSSPLSQPARGADREFLSKADAGYWLRRLYRNTYTHNGRLRAVKGWSVKIQRNGRRKSFSLKAADRHQAAGEALQIYQAIAAGGWDAVAQAAGRPDGERPGTGPGKQAAERLDAEHWRRKLVKRPYPAFLPEREREFAIYLEHAGVGHYLPLGTNVANAAAHRAAEICRLVREQGWEMVGQRHSWELAVALRWLDNPVAWTYTTLYTWKTSPLAAAGAAPSDRERRIALVEPDPGLRRSLASHLGSQEGFCCCHACSNLEELGPATRRQAVDLVLLNSSFREVPGATRLSQGGPLVTIGEAPSSPGTAKRGAILGVFYSVFEDADQLFKRTPGGAIGYLLKRTPLNRLLDPIAQVAGPLLPKPASAKIRKYFHQLVHAMPSGSGAEGLVRLTSREREILSQLAKGRVTKEIASTLGISSWTVNGHVKSIFAKLRVHTRTEAVVRYLEPVS
ncbi:MAG TPA: response regulator transcription factor [Dongiaceae bacterium]|nr:response regulator transcription factor [Dongiaceae bacterium]